MTEYKHFSIRIRELEQQVAVLEKQRLADLHHTLCSNRFRPVENCGLCQRLFTEQRLILDEGEMCIEYCATTRQSIPKNVRARAREALKLIRPAK